VFHYNALYKFMFTITITITTSLDGPRTLGGGKWSAWKAMCVDLLITQHNSIRCLLAPYYVLIRVVSRSNVL